MSLKFNIMEGGRKSKSPKVLGFQGPKNQDISKSHSNTSLTPKKVHLVYIKNKSPLLQDKYSCCVAHGDYFIDVLSTNFVVSGSVGHLLSIQSV